MGILDSLFGKNNVIPRNARFRITEEGRERLQEFSGDAEGRILMALETRGSSTVDTISIAGHVNRGTVERMIPSLVKQGCVQYVNSHPVEDPVS